MSGAGRLLGALVPEVMMGSEEEVGGGDCGLKSSLLARRNKLEKLFFRFAGGFGGVDIAGLKRGEG